MPWKSKEDEGAQNPGKNKHECPQVLWFGGTKNPHNSYPTCSCPQHYAVNFTFSIQINISEPTAAAHPEPQTLHSPPPVISPALWTSTCIFKLSWQLFQRPVLITHLPSLPVIWAAVFPMARTPGKPGMVHWIQSSRKAQRIWRSSWLKGTMVYLHSTGFFFI